MRLGSGQQYDLDQGDIRKRHVPRKAEKRGVVERWKGIGWRLLRTPLNKRRPRPKSGPSRRCRAFGARRVILLKHNGCEVWSGQCPAVSIDVWYRDQSTRVRREYNSRCVVMVVTTLGAVDFYAATISVEVRDSLPMFFLCSRPLRIRQPGLQRDR